MNLNAKKEGTYKSYIPQKNNKNNSFEIIFELIKFGENNYFAREIATSEIFPICNEKNKDKTFNEYQKEVYYFVNVPVNDENIIYKDETFYIPNLSNIEKYLHTFENELGDKKYRAIQEMAKSNTYTEDYEELKKSINRNLKSNYKKSWIDIKEISKYGYDLSKQKNLCNAVGREKELEKIIKTIGIKEKSIILIGEPGSGKTSLVEKIALEIDNIEWLNDKIIFYLNTSQIISGTKHRGEFEENINDIIHFCEKNKGRIILFIDEIHTLYGLGRTEASATDAMQILKPYISSGDIIVIGATTKKEYNEILTNDPAFCRRFDKIEISPPDRELNHQILISYIKELEKKYKIKLKIDKQEINNILDYILEITDVKCQKAIDDIKIENPTLAKTVIEDAFVEAIYNYKNNVSIEDINLAIINCDRISSINRKEVAIEFKEKVIKEEKVIDIQKVRKLKIN